MRDNTESVECSEACKPETHQHCSPECERECASCYDASACDTWRGYCDRGPCAAEIGHEGTCAEASGWVER